MLTSGAARNTTRNDLQRKKLSHRLLPWKPTIQKVLLSLNQKIDCLWFWSVSCHFRIRLILTLFCTLRRTVSETLRMPRTAEQSWCWSSRWWFSWPTNARVSWPSESQVYTESESRCHWTLSKVSGTSGTWSQAESCWDRRLRVESRRLVEGSGSIPVRCTSVKTVRWWRSAGKLQSQQGWCSRMFCKFADCSRRSERSSSLWEWT